MPIVCYFQKLAEITDLRTQNPGTFRKRGSNGWCKANNPLIFGIKGLE